MRNVKPKAKPFRRVIVLTGNGKGKTTSAIGCAVRAAGRGMKVGFYQFLKSERSQYGEQLFFKSGKKFKITPLGLGCRSDFNYTAKDIKTAQKGLQKIREEILKNKYGMVVLDEISYPVNWGWISIADIVDIVSSNPRTNFVLTGRDMPQAFIEIADTVSSVEEIKHIYRTGVEAQQGIEC